MLGLGLGRYAAAMTSPATYPGSCHCGACRFTFTTAVAPGNWPVRACSCTFCRAHAARYTSDPAGTVTLELSEASLTRYRFASNSSDFLICRGCGVFLGALTRFPDGTHAMVLNLNVLQGELPTLRAASMHEYQSEAPEERTARRKRNWTPVAG